MHKKLIIKAFEKAKKERQKQGEIKPAVVTLSEDISDFIDKHIGFNLGEKSFRIYRNNALKVDDSKEDINIKQLDIVLGLCKYLGFEKYEDFVSSLNSNDKTKKDTGITRKLSGLIKKNWFIIVIITCFIVFLIINSINKQRWMVWNVDHYVEVKFDTEKYNIGNLKLYKEERIINFKKIKPYCNKTKFFNSDGSIKIWYGKNIKGELECFTSVGLHPETGKILKPITNYMIEKYICSSSQKRN